MGLQNGVTKEIQDFFLQTNLEKINKLKFPCLDGELGFNENGFANIFENDESAEDFNGRDNFPLLPNQNESNIENAYKVEKAPVLISKHRIYIVIIVFLLISLIIAVAVAVVEIIKCSNNTHKSTTTFSFTTSSLSTTSPSLKCLEGWTYFEKTHSCYTVRRSITTWSVANKTCENGAAHLVSIHHQEEENFVKNLSGNFSRIPIGLHTYVSSRHFIDSYKWTDGSTVNYSNWADGQPPDDKRTHCVFIYKGKWNTIILCTESDDIVYVCKKPAVS